MEKFVDFYSKYDRAEGERKALEYLVKDKFDQTSFHDSQEIDVYHMNESLNTNTFIPGMFYTFKYNNHDEVATSKGNYIDRIPLCLCIGAFNDYVLGFNFNLILNEIRACILDDIYLFDKQFFEETLPNALKEKKAIVSSKIGNLFLNKGPRNSFIQYTSHKYRIPTASFAYRKYIKKDISNAFMIDYNLWRWIPFLNFEGSVHGMKLKEIQKANLLKQ